jgi:hypothetical protein
MASSDVQPVSGAAHKNKFLAEANSDADGVTR